MTSTLLTPLTDPSGKLSSVTKLDLQAVVRVECRRRRREKIGKFCRNFIACLCSHIGLASLVVSYSIVGAFLFQALEAPHENLQRAKIVEMKQTTIAEIWKIAQVFKMKDNFTNNLILQLDFFQNGIFEAIKDTGWDGRRLLGEPIHYEDLSPPGGREHEFQGQGRVDMVGSDLRWSYAGSLLYCVTVITTIGYGHLAPKTPLGRFLTILYAIVGIPLTFLYLSNVGNFLADSFRLFYRRVCCDVCCCRSCERKRRREIIKEKRKLFRASDIKRRMAFTSGDVEAPRSTAVVATPEVKPSCHEQSSIKRPPSSPRLPLKRPPSSPRLYREQNSCSPRLPLQATPSITLFDTAASNCGSGVVLLADDDISNSGTLVARMGSVSPTVTMTSTIPATPTRLPPTEDFFRYDHIVSDIVMAFRPDIRETDILNSDSDSDSETTVQRSPKVTSLYSASDEDDTLQRPNFYLPSEQCNSLQETKSLLVAELSTIETEVMSSKPGQSSTLNSRTSRKKSKRSASCKRRPQCKARSDTEQSAGAETGAEAGAVKGAELGADLGGDISSVKGSKKESRKSESTTTSPLENIRDRCNSTPLADITSNAAEEVISGNDRMRRTLSTRMGTSRSKHRSDSSLSSRMDSSKYRKNVKRLPEIMTNIEEGDDDAFDCDVENSPKQVTVPICVCLLIIAAYIFAGSILFTLWEDWDYLTGSYFCFITLSTIGFGDIVPGTDMKEWASQEKLVLCSLWLAFGLSLLAMCFNLMQEEVKEKGKWMGTKVGLIKN